MHPRPRQPSGLPQLAFCPAADHAVVAHSAIRRADARVRYHFRDRRPGDPATRRRTSSAARRAPHVERRVASGEWRNSGTSAPHLKIDRSAGVPLPLVPADKSTTVVRQCCGWSRDATLAYHWPVTGSGRPRPRRRPGCRRSRPASGSSGLAEMLSRRFPPGSRTVLPV